jgi:hypothetical protein
MGYSWETIGKPYIKYIHALLGWVEGEQDIDMATNYGLQLFKEQIP